MGTAAMLFRKNGIQRTFGGDTCIFDQSLNDIKQTKWLLPIFGNFFGSLLGTMSSFRYCIQNRMSRESALQVCLNTDGNLNDYGQDAQDHSQQSPVICYLRAIAISTPTQNHCLIWNAIIFECIHKIRTPTRWLSFISFS